MALTYKLVLGMFFLCLSVQLGLSLKCYECSSGADDKCGKTWGYEADSTKYLTECVGEKAACKKLEYNDFQQGKLHVTRSCWNTTDVHHEFDMGCESLGHDGETCYCTSDDGKPCNAGPLVQSYALLPLIVAGLSTLLYL